MHKTKTNRTIAMFLVFVMTLTMVTTTAFAASALDYYVPKEIYQPSSMAELADPENRARYNEEKMAESYRESLYRGASDKANLLPTDLDPTPLPEELGLDAATYWKEISLDGNTNGKTTRSTEELYQEIKQLANDLVEGKTTPSEKYTAIWRWVNGNIKYSTNNRTHNVYLAYERGYGACMERSNVAYLMATLAGLNTAIIWSPEHQGTAILEENGAWVGDGFKSDGEGAIPTQAVYTDGTTKFYKDFQTGAVTAHTIKAATPAISFNDVPTDAWYANAVNWAVAKGITNGTGNDTFSPAKTCTNTEIIAFLYRANGSPAVDSGVTLPFAVKNGWAADALKWA